MPYIEQLIQSIDNRILELRDQVTSLEHARSTLTANGSAETPSPRPKAKPPTRRPRSKVARAKKTQVLLADAAERMLSESDGLTTAALAEQAGADREQVLALLRDLEAAKRVRRTGQRRATRWHAITDEDRIRERAAELASRSKGGGTQGP